jgi:hypothetical protein
MFIILTNAAEAFKGQRVAINTDIIVSVYNTENLAKKNDGIIERVTYVFCPPHGTWEVEESMEEIVNIVNNIVNEIKR